MYPIGTVRHSCAHIMAAAISELWPEAKFGVGPDIENGFYYDVLFPEPIKFEDLGKIERLMKKIRRKKKNFYRRDVDIKDAINQFDSKGQNFKVELLEMLQSGGSTKIVEDTGDANIAPLDEGVTEVSLYEVNGFIDLCRGPHVEASHQIGCFKLHRLSGAYWRRNEKNQQLQRIYGLCYLNEEDLEAEIERLEQVKLRDHRRIGKELEIFHLSHDVGQGLPLWLPNGTVIRDELELLSKQREKKYGYERVVTPHLTNEKLYYRSGHLPYYSDDMYAPIQIEEEKYYLRPMNCPHHHQIYLSRPRSFRDLPVRYSEYGQVYRYESSGSLSGIMRTRGFCQNDAHIYCTFDQAKKEFIDVMKMHAEFYKLFDIKDYFMRLSLPDLDNLDKYVDEPEKWIDSLHIIKEAMEDSGLPYKEVKGEAAFYGPKIDFIIKSAIGTEYAISTNQLDFLATEKFKLIYTDKDGGEKPVYVIHRAPLGSHERFIGFLLEHYAGNFPIWLAPVMVKIIPISDKSIDYAKKVEEFLRAEEVPNGSLGIRAELDMSSERMNKKIRTAVLKKVPLVLVVGENESDSNTVSVRTRYGKDYGQIDLTEFRTTLIESIIKRDDNVFHNRFK